MFSSPKDNIFEIANQKLKDAFNKSYRCRVVAQNSDGTLELQMDPAIDLIKNGLSKVPYCPPIPNTKVTIGYGTYAVLAFLNGDPRYPRIVGWDSFTQPSKLEISATGAKAAARIDDECGYLVFTPNVGAAPAVLAYSPTPVPVTPPTILIGPLKIQKGSTDVSIG